MAEEQKAQTQEQNIKDILKAYDITLKENSNLKESWNLPNIVDDKNIEENILDVDYYWNFAGTTNPKIDVEFLTTKEDGTKTWLNINKNDAVNNYNTNNYIVSANISDNGFKELNLVLYDRNFTDIQRIISNSIETLNNKPSDNDDIYHTKSTSVDQDNKHDISYSITKDYIASNIRIRYGYNDNKHAKVNEKYVGMGSRKDGKYRWRTVESEYEIEDGKIKEVDKNKINNLSTENTLKNHMQQATLFSNWEEFIIIGLTTNLTNSGIKYNIRAISSASAKLNGYKIYQSYSSLRGKPKTLLASLMKMFNEQDSEHFSPIRIVWSDKFVSAEDAPLNGQELIYDYEKGTYNKIDETDIDSMKEKIANPIEDLTTYINMLIDLKSCFKKNTDNALSSYVNGLSIGYIDHIDDIVGKDYDKQISNKKSTFLDLSSIPYDTNTKADGSEEIEINKNDIIEAAKYQKILSDNFKILEDITDNKIVGKKDRETSIYIKDLIKIWLSNIAIKAYNIDTNESDLANLYNTEEDLKNKSSSLNNKYFKGMEKEWSQNNSLIIKWVFPKGNIKNLTINNYDNYNIPKKQIYIKSNKSEIGIDLLTFDIISENYSDINDKEASINNLYKNTNYVFENLFKYIHDNNIDVFFSTKIKLGEQSFEIEGTKKSMQSEIETLRKVLDNIKDDYKLIQNNRYNAFYNVKDKLNDFINKDLEKYFSTVECFDKHGDKGDIYKKDGDKYNLNFKLSELRLYYEYNNSMFCKITADEGYWLKIKNYSNFNNLSDFEKESNLKYLLIYIFNYLSFFLFVNNNSENYNYISEKDLSLTKENNNIVISVKGFDLIQTNPYGTQKETDHQKVLTEYKNYLNKLKENMSSKYKKEVGSFLQAKKANDDKIKEKEESIKDNGLIGAINTIWDDSYKNGKKYSIMELVIDEEGNKEKFGSYSNNKNMLEDLFKCTNLLIGSDREGQEKEIDSILTAIDKKIEKFKKELERLNKLSEKVDNTNVGKEIELSLGSQESRNANLKTKLTKNLSSILNDYCSQCGQRISGLEESVANNGKREVTTENGTEIIGVHKDFPRYSLTWDVLTEITTEQNNEKIKIPIVGIHYKNPIKPKKIRRYKWGNGNNRPHCIKNISISNSSEFALMHNISTITTTNGGSEAKNTDGEMVTKAENKKYSDAPSYFNMAFDTNRDEKIFKDMLNSINKGTITLLGDPSLRFEGDIQPYTYPIYLDISLGKEARSWSDNSNQIEKSQLSGYYVISNITHDINNSGYTTTLEIIKYPIEEDTYIGYTSPSQPD